jgi:hypothetical protein
MRSTQLLDIARRVADQVAAGYYPAEDGVSMIARQDGYDVALVREIRTQLSDDPDTLQVSVAARPGRRDGRPRTKGSARPPAGREPAVGSREDTGMIIEQAFECVSAG